MIVNKKFLFLGLIILIFLVLSGCGNFFEDSNKVVLNVYNWGEYISDGMDGTIDVNREFEVLYEFMEKLPDALRPGGRAAILTFHSGEDKLVKKALKQGYKDGIYLDYAKDVIRPSAQECAQNGRARSTKMRWAIKA